MLQLGAQSQCLCLLADSARLFYFDCSPTETETAYNPLLCVVPFSLPLAAFADTIRAVCYCERCRCVLVHTANTVARRTSSSAQHTPLRYVIGLVPSRQSLSLCTLLRQRASNHVICQRTDTLLCCLLSLFFSIAEPFNCLTSILNGNRNAKKKLASDYGNVLVPVGGSKENITTMHSFSIR